MNDFVFIMQSTLLWIEQQIDHEGLLFFVMQLRKNPRRPLMGCTERYIHKNCLLINYNFICFNINKLLFILVYSKWSYACLCTKGERLIISNVQLLWILLTKHFELLILCVVPFLSFSFTCDFICIHIIHTSNFMKKKVALMKLKLKCGDLS